jgi:hypothetical protein
MRAVFVFAVAAPSDKRLRPRCAGSFLECATHRQHHAENSKQEPDHRKPKWPTSAIRSAAVTPAITASNSGSGSHLLSQVFHITVSMLKNGPGM